MRHRLDKRKNRASTVFLVNLKNTSFFTDNFNCHALAHSLMHFNAELKLLTSISVAKTAYNFKLSANFFTATLYSDNTPASSLMYAMNSDGPMSQPWIVQLQRSSGSETTFPTRVVWVRPERKFLLQLSKYPSMPYCKPLNFRAPFIFANFAGK